MSKMADLVLDVKYLMDEGMSFVQIARELEIPVNFVVEAADLMTVAEMPQDCDPFATVNS
jgi:orotate phosphoribosyltransferase-like protein